MSLRTILSVASVVCLVPLVGCDENEEPRADSERDPTVADGSRPSFPFPSHAGGDAGVTVADAAPSPSTPSAVDAGGPSQVIDAGAGDASADESAPVPSARFFLPTPEPTNTSAPSVEVDAAGNVHSVYPAYVRGGAYYSVCAGSCEGEDQVQVVEFETEGTVGNAMLALTSDGRPRILLSSYQRLYWAECDAGCGERANWKLSEILNHGSDRAVTGEALALDPQGRPRFVMHTYRALFGIGQKTPETLLAQCDAACEAPTSWRYDVIAKDQIWEGSTLRYDAKGKGHIVTNVYDFGEQRMDPVGAYLSCEGACNADETWNGIGFFPPYESMTEAVDMHPAISLALTKDGKPRVAQLGKTPEGKKILAYFECDESCETDHWTAAYSWTADQFNQGIDLALDPRDRPRIAHTINYNIVLTYCDSADCKVQGADWNSAYVESGEDIPADNIFLEWNCTIGAWFLHSPSIAITSDGKPRVGYQSRDVSGGVSQPDPTKPRCAAGTDMTFSRLAVMK
jgi:hypothetical protein